MTYEKHGLFVDEAHLESFAENYARGLLPDGKVSGRRASAELRQALRMLRETHDALARQWAEVPAMPGAVRWLLDNAYLAYREGQSAARAFRTGPRLRRCSQGSLLDKERRLA